MGEMIMLTLAGAGRVFLGSLVFGVGLPVIFALGIRAHGWAIGAGRDGEEATTPARHAIGQALFYLCIVLVLIGILIGLAVIIASGFGVDIVFNGLVPTIERG